VVRPLEVRNGKVVDLERTAYDEAANPQGSLSCGIETRLP